MTDAAGTVLVINSGSSSIKYQLVDPEDGNALATGLVERIGEPTGRIKHSAGGQDTVEERPFPDHAAGLKRVVELFDAVGPKLADAHIVAVGHRIVQGGSVFPDPAVVDDHVVQQIRDLATLAPLHNGPAATGIEVARELFPDIPHVAVFDSSFFQRLPREASTYALDKELADKYAVRRYGAHGTSHEFIGGEVAKFLGKPLDGLRQIVLHLGNGASASAQLGSRPIDTSMGLTPLEGLVMGTRTGDIDPAVVFHLARNAHLSIDELDDVFNKRSGLKGLTGEGDMRSVHALAADGNEDAKLALDIYVHRLVKYIGGYWTLLGGLDAITFTAGIGENDDIIRARTAERLAPFGVKLDAEANSTRSKEPRAISTPDSSVPILVIPTNEELAIARKTVALVGA